MKESPLLLPGVILLTGVMVSAALVFHGRPIQIMQPAYQSATAPQQMMPSQPMDGRMMGTEMTSPTSSAGSMKPATSPAATTTRTASTAAQQTLCVESGGTYTNTRCNCPTGYTFSGGECFDSFGLQGGRTGAKVKARQELLIQKDTCEYSGGVMRGSSCSCPTDYTLSSEGVCTDAFGLPGGQNGKDIQASYPTNN